jgi:hypothetical protein
MKVKALEYNAIKPNSAIADQNQAEKDAKILELRTELAKATEEFTQRILASESRERELNELISARKKSDCVVVN